MRIEVNFLYAGQGTCNCIKIFDSKENLAGLLLIDMGSKAHGRQGEERSWGPCWTDAVTFVTDAVKQRGGIIDVLVISHLDIDHYNYIKHIENNLTKITHLVIGGTPLQTAGMTWNQQYAYYTQTTPVPNNELKILHEFLAGKYTNLYMVDNSSDYVGNTHVWDRKEGYQQVRLRVLVNRCFYNQRLDNAEYINGNSAVMVLEYYSDFRLAAPPDMAIIFPGDAISETYQDINAFFTQINAGFLHAGYKGMAAAHHGSYTTHYRKGDGMGSLEAFLGAFQPALVYVSACEMHNHPNSCVVNIYGRSTEITQQHYNRVYSAAKGYVQEKCWNRTYTSYYQLEKKEQITIGWIKNMFGQPVPYTKTITQTDRFFRRVVVTYVDKATENICDFNS